MVRTANGRGRTSVPPLDNLLHFFAAFLALGFLAFGFSGVFSGAGYWGSSGNGGSSAHSTGSPRSFMSLTETSRAVHHFLYSGSSGAGPMMILSTFFATWVSSYWPCSRFE